MFWRPLEIEKPVIAFCSRNLVSFERFNVFLFSFLLMLYDYKQFVRDLKSLEGN